MNRILFATNASLALGTHIAERVGVPIGKADITRSADGEVLVRLKESVAGKDVYVIGSSHPPAEHLLELLILINTIKIHGAKNITAIVPYYGYAKADRTDRPGWSVTARLVAQCIEAAGADAFVGVTLHSERIQSFFKIPTHHLDAVPLLASHFRGIDTRNVAVASPDLGGVKRAKEFAKILGVSDVITIVKERPTEETAVVVKIIGEPKDKSIILVDDMIQSGNTIVEAVKALKMQGAGDIRIAVAHLVTSGHAIEKLETIGIKEIVVTDTVPLPDTMPSECTIISVTELIGNHLART